MCNIPKLQNSRVSSGIQHQAIPAQPRFQLKCRIRRLSSAQGLALPFPLCTLPPAYSPLHSSQAPPTHPLSLIFPNAATYKLSSPPQHPHSYSPALPAHSAVRYYSASALSARRAACLVCLLWLWRRIEWRETDCAKTRQPLLGMDMLCASRATSMRWSRMRAVVAGVWTLERRKMERNMYAPLLLGARLPGASIGCYSRLVSGLAKLP
jgi:hypothetical protein